MTLYPAGDHLVVKPIPTEEKSASGIIIPDTVGKERSERGEVIAIGPGRIREDGAHTLVEIRIGDKIEEVKAGDRIIFKKYAPDEVKDGSDVLFTIGFDDVIAVIK